MKIIVMSANVEMISTGMCKHGNQNMCAFLWLKIPNWTPPSVFLFIEKQIAKLMFGNNTIRLFDTFNPIFL